VKVHEALARVMVDVTHVGKDGKNQSQGYNFRGIDGVLNAVGPAFRRHGIVPLPEIVDERTEVVEVGKARTPMRSVTVKVRYYFIGPEGDHLMVFVPGEAMDSGDKAFSKAMSVAYRTALIQTLALPTHEPDPDEESYERAPAPQSPGFDVSDQDTWPAAMTPGQAKEIVLEHVGGDRDAAKALWVTHFDGQTTVLADFLIRVLTDD
jgi:hypothetical protein